MKQQEISQSYPGLNFFKDGVRIPIDSIPGLKLTGWNGQNYGTKRIIDETLDPEQLCQALRLVHNQVTIRFDNYM